MIKRTHLLVFAVVFSATIMGLSYDVVEILRPGEPTVLYSEAFEMSGQVWINGDDLVSGDTVIYGAPLTVTITDPDGEIYRIDYIRSKTEEQKNSLACTIACGASIEHLILDTADVQPGEWEIRIRYAGDSEFRPAENVLKYQVG